MKKFLLIIDGPMGSGKTAVAKLLHEEINNTAHIGLDRIKWLVSGFRRSKPHNEKARAVVMAMVKEYLRQGISVILEQGMKSEVIESYKKIAKNNQAKFFIYQLDAPKDVLLKRIGQRPAVPGKPKVLNSRIERNYRIYKKYRYKKAVTIDTENLSPGQIAKQIFKAVKA